MKKDLIRFAKNGDTVSFERTYKRLINPNANGSEIASQMVLHKNLPDDYYTSSPGGGTSTGSSTTTGGSSESVVSKAAGWVNDKIKTTAGITNEMLQTQISKNTTSNLNLSNDLMKMIERNGVGLKNISDIISLAFTKVNEQLELETELLGRINQETSITGQLSEGLRTDMENSTIYAEKFGISLREIGDMYVSLVKESGKLTMINRGLIEQALPLSKAFGISMDTLGQTISTFSDVGIGAQDTIKALSDAGVKSTSLGLSGKKIITDIQSNIGKLNEYGFKNGIEGLTRMVQKMNEFKVSFESVKTVAEKVFEPEGALDLVANIQAIGGAVGDLNDPLKLMYMAINNVEGLQDAIIGASKSLATYNQEQGRFELTGVNLRLARARAQALGISYEEFSKTAIKAAERTSAANTIMSKGFNLSDKQTEFLTNLSTMEGGEMIIKLPEDIANKIGAPANIALSRMDEKTKELLLNNQDLIEKMSTEDMAQRQLTQLGEINNNTNAMARYYTIRAARGVKGATEGLLGQKATSFNKNLKESVTIRRGKIGTVEDKKEMKEKVEKFKEHPIDYSVNALKTMYDRIKEDGVQGLTKNEYTDAFYMALVKYNYDFKKTVESFNGSGGHSDYLNKK